MKQHSTMEESKGRVILIAMDAEHFADHAFDCYVNNIHQENDYAILLYCCEYHVSVVSDVGGLQVVTDGMEKERKAAERYKKKLTDLLKEHHLQGRVQLVYGSPETEIPKLADEENVDMIITGARDMGTFRRALVGSVSDHVLHNAHVPVLICRKWSDNMQKHTK